MGTLSGKVAIVTGAANGVGRATAMRMAQEGASVVVADIDAAGAAAVVGEVAARDGEAVAVTVDVSREEDVVAMVGVAVDTFGRLDILHNNAADVSDQVQGNDCDIVDLDVAIWDRTLAVNLRGVMLGCKHAIPALVRSGGGSIINTASTAAYLGNAVRAAYGASKGGIVALTRYVAVMYGAKGIRCNAIAPGLILSKRLLQNYSEEQIEAQRANRLVPRAGRPEDVAALAVFLASDDGGYITGETIVLDGGFLAFRTGLSRRVSVASDDGEP